jgi:hypothetical protein
MTDHIDPPVHPDPLDELVSELLGVGAVLSQIISNMVRFQAAGKSAPDAAPIPEIAHRLIRDVVGDLRSRHSKRDLRVAAAIIGEATNAIADNLFFVDPDLI